MRDPEKYRQVFSLALGVWLDNDWRQRGWDAETVSKNYFTPETFAASVGEALRISDDYVWIYSETPRWWSPEGKAVKLPADYEAALRTARGLGGDRIGR